MKKKTNIHILELAEYKQPEVIEDGRDDWVCWGEDNDYYDWLTERARKSATNNACINTISRMVYGRGLSALDASRKPSDYAAMKALFTPDCLRYISEVVKMLGAGYFQVIYSKKGKRKVIAVDYVETNLVRPQKCDENGEIKGFYFSDNWEDTNKYEPEFYPAFGTSNKEIEILEIRKKSVGLKYFTPPDYEGALAYTVLEEEIADYLVNTVQTSFSGTSVINFNNGIPDKETQRIEAGKIKKKVTGATGDKTIVAFNANKEQATTVDKIPLDDAADLYNQLAIEARNKILNCHSVTSPMLVGIQNDGSGFSSSADEIEVGSRFFYNQAIKPTQDLITDAIDQILAVNGISLDLYFKRLNLMEEVEEKEQVEEHVKEVRFNSHLEGLLAGFGETVNEEEWILLDERDVDYDQEENFNSQVKAWTDEIKDSLKQTTLGKIKAWLAGTGTARPNAKSSQDREVDGFYFKVRYEYVGEHSDNGRDFCKAMMRAGKQYRKEDIKLMNSELVNAGHGHNGQDYDIWLYKGGVNCKHKWKRKTYVSASAGIDVNSPLANTVSTGKAQRFGYRVDNESEVSMKPIDMPRNGHHPNY